MIPAPPPDAVAMAAFRILPNGEGRRYTEVWTPDRPYRGVERFVRMCGKVGWLRAAGSTAEPYAVLDIMNEDGDIVADYRIPDARAFRRIYQRLGLRVVDERTTCV